jgi:hypothetical protein
VAVDAFLVHWFREGYCQLAAATGAPANLACDRQVRVMTLQRNMPALDSTDPVCCDDDDDGNEEVVVVDGEVRNQIYKRESCPSRVPASSA